MRFWLISTKVDRKIASTDAIIARMTNDGSNCGMPEKTPRLPTIHAPNIAKCRYTKRMLPVKRVMAAAKRSSKLASAASRARRRSRARMLRSRTDPSPGGFGEGLVGAELGYDGSSSIPRRLSDKIVGPFRCGGTRYLSRYPHIGRGLAGHPTTLVPHRCHEERQSSSWIIMSGRTRPCPKTERECREETSW